MSDGTIERAGPERVEDRQAQHDAHARLRLLRVQRAIGARVGVEHGPQRAHQRDRIAMPRGPAPVGVCCVAEHVGLVLGPPEVHERPKTAGAFRRVALEALCHVRSEPGTAAREPTRQCEVIQRDQRLQTDLPRTAQQLGVARKSGLVPAPGLGFEPAPLQAQPMRVLPERGGLAKVLFCTPIPPICGCAGRGPIVDLPGPLLPVPPVVA